MKIRILTTRAVALGVMVASATGIWADDWPQWRGPHRDAKVTGFKAPASWPKELAQQWKITVGEGVATPALVGNRLYVFSRQDGNEILRCLDAGTSKELWQDKYPAEGATGPAAGFSGPRCSPTVADGKVVTVGVRGTLSCLDAATGKKLWRKDDIQGWPRFFTGSSPIVVNGLCIAQLGGQENGALVAYDLATGEEKWKWSGDSPAYASPVLMTVDGSKLIIAMTETKIVACDTANGKLVWETPFKVQGRGYNAATPMVDGQTLFYAGSGRGVTAVQFAKQGDKVSAKELWKNTDKSVQFNTPVIKDGLLYGITQGNDLFCLNVQDGKTAWSAPLGQPGMGGGAGRGAQPGGGAPPAPPGQVGRAQPQRGREGEGGQPQRGGPPSGGRGGRGGRGGGGAGYGSIVDAGSVLLALTPNAQLVVFEPSDKAFKQVAKYKVADKDTYAYPVLAGNRVYVKDGESLILWTVSQ
jgi:outer membrane protein assembly factor BamB